MRRKAIPRWDARAQYWRLYHNGSRVNLCAGAGNERLAWAEAHKIWGTSERPSTVTTVCTAWLEANGSAWHRSILAPFADWAESVTLTEVHGDFLVDYLTYLAKQTTYSPSTIRRQLRYARAVLRWASVREYLTRPVPRLPKLPALPQYSRAVDPAVMRRVFAEIPYPAKHILTFMAATWCRSNEACGLKFAEIEGARCILHRGKTWRRTGRERWFYLNSEARQTIEAQPWRNGYVFRSRLTKRYTVSGLGDIFNRAAKRANIRMTQGQIRHTGAQDAINRGVPVDVVAIQLGHAPGSPATRSYVSFSHERTHDLLESHVSPLLHDPDESVPPDSAPVPPFPQAPGPRATDRRGKATA